MQVFGSLSSRPSLLLVRTLLDLEGDGTELERMLSCVGHAHGRALHWLDLYGDSGDCVDVVVVAVVAFGKQTCWIGYQ